MIACVKGFRTVVVSQASPKTKSPRVIEIRGAILSVSKLVAAFAMSPVS
jgi:hypothetical protein